ncbi:MAG TPA: TfoX/Sxy family protein [Cyclobacteriaceae bacterium]|jgi:TfoX/Sxy family transcriptional regulator of competence genes|nr:TfoX/Sxy family protein [Cyclobacteriaceae bacterium]
MAYNETLAGRMRQVLQDTKGVVEKKMFGGTVFMWKDKMFCGIIKDDLMIRVLEERYADLVERTYARPMDFVKSRPMRGYIYVALEGLKTEKQLASWINWGKEYAEKSPPKRKARKKTIATKRISK